MLAGYQRIVVLTGAGISHASGLPTYRGPGGLWTDALSQRLQSLLSAPEEGARVGHAART